MERSQARDAFNSSPYRSLKVGSYFSVYDELFGKFIGKEVTFVEVGVLGGGSLFMWRTFFGEQARIIGVDLNPGAKKWEEFGFEIFIGDQSDPGFWRLFRENVGDIDILLDDGGHTYRQQVVTVECMLDAIRDGGLLVVEDTHTSYLTGFGPRSHSFVSYAKRMIDKVNARFSGLTCEDPDYRTWSILFFESIVAFRVFRPYTTSRSNVVSNHGTDDQARDFRYAGTGPGALDSIFWTLDRRFSGLKRVPGLRMLALRIRSVSLGLVSARAHRPPRDLFP